MWHGMASHLSLVEQLKPPFTLLDDIGRLAVVHVGAGEKLGDSSARFFSEFVSEIGEISYRTATTSPAIPT